MSLVEEKRVKQEILNLNRDNMLEIFELVEKYPQKLE